jgi:hypothetical protein
MVPFALANTWGFESDDEDLEFHLLQVGRRGLRWSRTEERTFEIESLDEPFL